MLKKFTFAKKKKFTKKVNLQKVLNINVCVCVIEMGRWGEIVKVLRHFRQNKIYERRRNNSRSVCCYSSSTRRCLSLPPSFSLHLSWRQRVLCCTRTIIQSRQRRFVSYNTRDNKNYTNFIPHCDTKMTNCYGKSLRSTRRARLVSR